MCMVETIMADAEGTPKRLDSRELTNAVDQILQKNVRLSMQDRQLIARMYDKFRGRIAPALSGQDYDNLDVFFWIDVIGDMMTLAKTFKVPGMEKKEIVLEVLDLVVENEVPEGKQAAVRNLIQTTVSPAIDLAVYFLNHIKPKCKSLFRHCGRCE